MDNEQLLATAGSTIKLWDTQNFKLCQEITSGNGRVSGLTWNQDGQCIASLGETGEEIFLSAVNAKSAANIGVVRGIEAPTSIKFASQSPHILGAGSRNGTVTVWNVKLQSQLKMYSVTESDIAQISFSHKDTHITAASRKGTIYSVSVVNNSTAGPFKIFNNQAVTDLVYSHVKKSLLGCCSEGGAIALFDSNANKTVHTFQTAHHSPVTALLFSPVNEMLMISVGYDKKLACYNVQTKQPLMTYRSSAPLTSAAFLAGGQQVALGSMTGQVFIHDLRSIRPPITVISAHKTAVTSVLLQPPSRSKSENIVGGHTRKPSTQKNTNVPLAVPQTKQAKSCSDQPEEPSSLLKPKSYPSPASDVLSPDVFSPIRPMDSAAEINTEQGFEKWAGLDSSTESLNTNDVLSPIRPNDQPLKGNFSPLAIKLLRSSVEKDDLLTSIRATYGMDGTTNSPSQNLAMSQINVNSGVTMSSLSRNDKENVKPADASELQLRPSIATSHKVGHLSPLCEANDPQVNTIANINLNTSRKLGKNFQQDPDMCNKEIKNTDGSKCSGSLAIDTKTDSEPVENLPRSSEERGTENQNKIPPSSAQQNVLPDESLSSSTTESREDLGSMEKTLYARISPPITRSFMWPIQASDLLAESPNGVKSTEENSLGLSPTNVSDTVKCGNGVSRLQVELIRNCMADVLEEFQDDVNRRLMHLQCVVTKQFLKQQEVMEHLHRQYSLNEDLLQENERLRQEISHLKATY
nr:protein NEDD1-like isoform X2 [Procambarus clarkii]